MNKKSIKFLITITFIFLLIPNVHAFVNKNNPVCNVDIDLVKDGRSTGWKSKADLCIVSESYFDGKTFRAVYETSNFFGAIEAADSFDDQITGWVESLNAKESSLISMYRCNQPERYVEVEAHCTMHYTRPAGQTCYTSFYNSGNCSFVRFDQATRKNVYSCCRASCDEGTLTTSSDGSYICSITKDYDRKTKAQNGYLEDKLDVNQACRNNADARGDNPRCTGCTAVWRLMCPVYTCPSYVREFSACTPKFEVGNSVEAYCVNPSNSFDRNSIWKADPNFNVRNCQTSHSTIDCGYANILIEGNYLAKKTGDETKWHNAIEFALRLWSAHSNRSGVFTKKVSVSNLIGSGCDVPVQFAPGQDNIYGKTYSSKYGQFLDLVTKYMKNPDYFKDGYLDASRYDELFDITCGELSVACAGGSADRGFALFFNTVFGNSHMQEHLNELYGLLGDEVNVRPDNVGVETNDETGERDVVITYENTVEVSSEEKQFDCSKLDEYDLTEEQRKYIGQYCTVKVEELYVVYSDGHEEKVDVNNNDKIYDASKGTLRVEAKYFSVCTENKYKTFRVVINYPKSKPGLSVQKYIACNGDSNQYLFAFYKENEIPAGYSDSPDEQYYVGLNCSNRCTDYGLQTSEPECQSKENSVYTGYIKDPSLKCIVNMDSPINQGYYDYSNYFGVNTDFCRVYCSDEVNYHIADKITIPSGLSFKYNIKPPGLTLNESDKLVTSVIEEKRICVSEIYYEKNFPTTPDWEGLYGITQSDINAALPKDKNNPSSPKFIRNWKDLYTVLKYIQNDEGSDRDENLVQLVYDLYNCNFAKANLIPVRKPSNNKIGNVYDHIADIYKDEKTEEFKKFGLDITTWTDNITYIGGADYINKNYKVGESESPITTNKNVSGNISDKIKYCKEPKDKDGNVLTECLAYKTPNKSDPNSANVAKENYSYSKFKESSTIGNTEKYYGTVVPSNDYAMFEISVQVDFYNNEAFQVQSYTGKVMNKNDNTSNLPLIDLDSFVYPMSKNAYNRCNKEGDNGTKRCDITQTFSGITTFYRIRPMDKFKLTINDYNKFVCGVDVEPPEVDPPTIPTGKTTIHSGEVDTYYRNVNLSNLFPTEASKNKTTNWSMPYGIQATKEIEESSKSINTSKYLEYRVVLTPETIKEIKDYNTRKETSGGYLDDSIDHDSCKVSDKKFFDCESKFLQNIRNGRERFGIDPNPEINKLDGMSDYTKEQLGIQ